MATVVGGTATRTRKKPQATRFGRGDRSPLGLWFWEIDRVLLFLVALLISIGLIAVAAASPAAAVRYSGGAVRLHPALLLLPPAGVARRRHPGDDRHVDAAQAAGAPFALGGAAFFSVLLVFVPLIGVEVNGAHRWIGVGFAQFQPSEFLKPMYTVTLAWLLSLRAHDKSLPIIPLSGLLTAIIAVLLMKQPDFGQTVIFCGIWVALLTLAGVPMKWLYILAAAGMGLIVTAYFFYSVAHDRINRFLYNEGDTYQIDSAHNTLINGGLIGTGPGSGVMKFRLPEPHTDYIFSVIGEEFGLLACLAIAFIYLAIVVRVFLKLLHKEDDFLLLASAGLVIQFGLQALINMAVNVGIAPSKGMTLPFISYGGSSMVALSLGFGLLLAFTRSNPYLTRSPYVVKWSGR